MSTACGKGRQTHAHKGRAGFFTILYFFGLMHTLSKKPPYFHASGDLGDPGDLPSRLLFLIIIRHVLSIVNSRCGLVMPDIRKERVQRLVTGNLHNLSHREL